MKRILSIAALVLVLAGAHSPCRADLMLFEIRAPKHCPEGLIIKAKPVEGLIQFDVEVDREKIAHPGELYKGRVRAHAVLKIAAATEQPLASVTLHESAEGPISRYQFRIASSALKSSELQLGLSLYEKNGKPTLGGGQSMQIHLVGFEPKASGVTK